MPKEAVPDEIETKVDTPPDTVNPEFKISPDISEQKPATGAFPYTKDKNGNITIYDDIDVDLTWISEAHVRAYNRLIYVKTLIRNYEIKVIQLSNEIARLTGKPVQEIVAMEFLDPPEAPSDLVVIGERAAQRFIRMIITNIVMLFIGLFVGWTIFLLLK